MENNPNFQKKEIVEKNFLQLIQCNAAIKILSFYVYRYSLKQASCYIGMTLMKYDWNKSVYVSKFLKTRKLFE